MSYVKSSSGASGKLPWNFSSVIRNWIVAPVKDAGIQMPVEASEPMVETPMLLLENRRSNHSAELE